MRKLIVFILVLTLGLGCQSEQKKDKPAPPNGEMPPGGPPMPPEGFPEDMPPPPPFNLNPHENAVFYINNGQEVKENQVKNAWHQ